MPRSPTTFVLPPGTTPQVPNSVIQSSVWNAALDDIATTFNTPQPIEFGGTAGTSVITGWDGLAAGGTDIASSGTINLTTATGPILTITGTTTITTVTLATNSIRVARANAAFQLTASANLIINGSASSNYTTTAGDLLIFIGGSGSVTRVWAISGSVQAASNAEVTAGLISNKYVSPLTAYFPTGHLNGFAMTPAADAANDFSMAVGTARSSDDTTNIILGSVLIKQIDATWVVGTNQGGRFFTTLTAGSKIYAYVIKDPVNNLIDWGYSDNASDPTGGASYPAAYTKYARVGSFWRSAGSVNQAARNFSIPATDWVAYTSTFTAFGTATSISFFSRRNGPDLEVKGKFTAGTPTASEARISLGFNGTDSNVMADGTVIASIRPAGQLARAAADIDVFVLTEPLVSYMTFSRSSVGGLTKANGSGMIGSSEAAGLFASFPIAGW